MPPKTTILRTLIIAFFPGLAAFIIALSFSSRDSQSAIIKYPIVNGLEKTPIPGIFVKNSTLNLGTVQTNDRVHAIFELTNYGASTLNITSVAASCGCTSVDSYPPTIMPKQTVNIPVTVNTETINGPQFQKVVAIKFEGFQPALTLNLVGEIDGFELAAYPARVEAKIEAEEHWLKPIYVRGDEAIVSQLPKVIDLSQKPKILRLDFVKPAKLTRVVDREILLKIDGSNSSTTKSADFTTEIRFETSDTTTKRLALLIHAEIAPAINATPKSLILGDGPESIYLRSTKGPISIIGISSGPNFKTEIKRNNDTEDEVRVYPSGASVTALENGVISISFANNDQLIIPVTCFGKSSF